MAKVGSARAHSKRAAVVLSVLAAASGRPDALDVDRAIAEALDKPLGRTKRKGDGLDDSRIKAAKELRERRKAKRLAAAAKDPGEVVGE